MKVYAWNSEKNELLKADRRVSFEEIVLNIQLGNEVDIFDHPNQESYPGQQISVVLIENYAYLVPFVENENELFLKTIIPSRKATKNMLVIRMRKLDHEEKEILEAFESGNLKRVENQAQEIKRHQAIAEATFKKDARINIRLSSRDLRALQARALQEGMPYQTLVSSVLHKFIDGQLIDKSVNK